MRDAWQIGRLFGIPLRIHLSWLIIFGLVSWSLAAGYFPAAVPDLPVWSYWARAVVAAAMLFVSVILHELGHSLMARRHGVGIAGITLFVFGGVSEMKEEPRAPGQEFQIAIVGPVISLALAVIFAALAALLGRAGVGAGTLAMVGYLAWINLLLAVFNMLPAFPLDGGRVLRALLWRLRGDVVQATRWAAAAGRGLALFIVVLGVFQLFAGNLGGLWLVLIGWFIMQAGSAGVLQASLAQALGGLRVRDVMTTDVKTIEVGASVEDLVERYLARFTYGGYPVQRDGRVVGLVTLHELRDVPPERRPTTAVEAIMMPVRPELTIDADTPVIDAFRRMAAGAGRLLVLDQQERLRGLVTLRGLAHLAHVRSALGAS